MMLQEVVGGFYLHIEQIRQSIGRQDQQVIVLIQGQRDCGRCFRIGLTAEQLDRAVVARFSSGLWCVDFSRCVGPGRRLDDRTPFESV